MDPEKAIKMLEQALNQATIKGAFDLNEVSHIIQALQALKPLIDKK